MSVTSDELLDIEWQEHGQAPVTVNDVIMLYTILAENDEWINALAKRGIDDPSQVHLEPWITGVHPPEMPTGRIFRAIAFQQREPNTNYYAFPIEGLTVLVDVDGGGVLVQDTGVVPVPDRPAEYTAEGGRCPP